MKKYLARTSLFVGAMAMAVSLASCGTESYHSVKTDPEYPDTEYIGEYKEITIKEPVIQKLFTDADSKISGFENCKDVRNERLEYYTENQVELYAQCRDEHKVIKLEKFSNDGVKQMQITTITDYTTGNRYDSLTYIGTVYSLEYEAFTFADGNGGFTEYVKVQVNNAAKMTQVEKYIDDDPYYVEVPTYYSGSVCGKVTGEHNEAPSVLEGYIFTGFVCLLSPASIYPVYNSPDATQYIETTGTMMHDYISLDGTSNDVYVKDGLLISCDFETEKASEKLIYDYDATMPECTFMNETMDFEEVSNYYLPAYIFSTQILEDSKNWIISAKTNK